MPATNLSFAKVVATPTNSSWSQAYNAGSLFIVLSLLSEDEDVQKELPTIGKQILNNIETEFFTLTDKSFETIKQALIQALQGIAEEVQLSLSLAYSKEDMLYAFIVGGGRITLKREDTIGTILHKDQTDSREILSASGYLETDDLILLQTTQFASSVPAKTITQAFEFSLPNDIAETISPHVHGQAEGGASAIIISYKGTSKSLEEAQADSDELLPESELSVAHPIPPLREPIQKAEESIEEEPEEKGPSLLSRIANLLPRFGPTITGRRKVALGLTVLLVGLLLVSIFVVRSTQQSSKERVLFEEIYKAAKKDYDEGEGLLSLNKPLARDDYLSAKSELDKAKGKFKPGSTEATKLAALEELVNKRLAETSDSTEAKAKEVSEDDAPELLRVLKDSPSLLAATEDEDAVYTLSSKELSKITKASKKKETLIKNDDRWDKAVSLGIFSGNLYVLDQKDVHKFVPTSDGFTPNSYFKSEAPDLKTAVSIAIDSSIYILFSDGEIQKYTRGTKDSFAVSGLKKELILPASIFTSPDLSSVYILDSGSGRIVKVDKNGKFEAEYTAPLLKDAKFFTVAKDEKSAFALSSGKIYQLSL